MDHPDRIAADLSDLGVRAGGVLLAHCSLSSLGHVEGGSTSVVQGLLKALSPAGTLMIPALSYESAHVEVLQIDLEIEATTQKAVSAQSLTESLTTFGELYREALPEERRELIRLRVNQLVWKPDEIRLALLDTPKAYQRLAESPQLVARALDSTNSGIVWDSFEVHQGHKSNTRYIEIGRQPRRIALKIAKHRNPLKQALEYQALLDAGEVDSQTELARLCNTPRSTISAYLRLLGLDAKVQAETIALDDDDERLDTLTESQLRGLLGKRSSDQRKRLSVLLDGNTR